MALPAITPVTLTDGGGGGTPTTPASPLPVSFAQALLILKNNAGGLNQNLVLSQADKDKLVATLTGKPETDDTTAPPTNYIQYLLAGVILFVIFKTKAKPKS